MVNNLKDLITLAVAFFGLMGTLIGVHYLVTDVIYTGLHLFNPWPSDTTRLKSELYSLNEVKKSTFYLTVIAIFIALFIGFYYAPDSFGVITITFIILAMYLLLIKLILHIRNKKVLTVNYRCKTWYLLFSTDEGYLFSTAKNKKEYNQNLHQLQYFKREQLFKHFSGYVDISKDNSEKD